MASRGGLPAAPAVPWRLQKFSCCREFASLLLGGHTCWGTHLLGDMCLVHENARFFPKAGATCPPRESEVQFPDVPQSSGPVPWPSSACPGCSSLALPQKLLTSNIFSCSCLILVPGFCRLSHRVCLLKFVVRYIFKIRGDEYFPFLYSLPCFF